MRRPGIEPGSAAWQAAIIPLDQRRCDKDRIFLFLPFLELHLPIEFNPTVKFHLAVISHLTVKYQSVSGARRLTFPSSLSKLKFHWMVASHNLLKTNIDRFSPDFNLFFNRYFFDSLSSSECWYCKIRATWIPPTMPRQKLHNPKK